MGKKWVTVGEVKLAPAPPWRAQGRLQKGLLGLVPEGPYTFSLPQLLLGPGSSGLAHPQGRLLLWESPPKGPQTGRYLDQDEGSDTFLIPWPSLPSHEAQNLQGPLPSPHKDNQRPLCPLNQVLCFKQCSLP